MIVYRIIKFEGEPEAIERQLNKSIMPGFRYTGFTQGMTITVKDRLEDPNEKGFFDDVKEHKGMLTKQQYLAIMDEQAENSHEETQST